MNILTQNTKTMSSREIAELTNKKHTHVMRDIRAYVGAVIQMERGADVRSMDWSNDEGVQLLGDTPVSGVTFTTELNPQNKQTYPICHLDKNTTLVIVSGYNVLLRKKIIERWAELEQQAVATTHRLPQSFAEALQLAADQAKQLELAAPKVNAYDKLIESTHLKSVGDVAKSIGLRSAQALNKKLEAVRAYDGRCGNRVWSGWFVEQGLGEMRTTDEGYSSNKMTAKGQAWALNLFGGNE